MSCLIFFTILVCLPCPTLVFSYILLCCDLTTIHCLAYKYYITASVSCTGINKQLPGPCKKNPTVNISKRTWFYSVVHDGCHYVPWINSKPWKVSLKLAVHKPNTVIGLTLKVLCTDIQANRHYTVLWWKRWLQYDKICKPNFNIIITQKWFLGIQLESQKWLTYFLSRVNIFRINL